MRDPVNSDFAITSGEPQGLRFLGIGGQGARVHRASPEDSSVGLELGEPRLHESQLTVVLSPWLWGRKEHSRPHSLLLNLTN